MIDKRSSRENVYHITRELENCVAARDMNTVLCFLASVTTPLKSISSRRKPKTEKFSVGARIEKGGGKNAAYGFPILVQAVNAVLKNDLALRADVD